MYSISFSLPFAVIPFCVRVHSTRVNGFRVFRCCCCYFLLISCRLIETCFFHFRSLADSNTFSFFFFLPQLHYYIYRLVIAVDTVLCFHNVILRDVFFLFFYFFSFECLLVFFVVSSALCFCKLRSVASFMPMLIQLMLSIRTVFNFERKLSYTLPACCV